MALAGFSVGEAEGLRRAMSRKRSEEAIEAFRARFVEGAVGQGGRAEATADAVYDKLVGFSGFGFPKSHAAAFALLAYQSAWLRHHYPAEFLCALLNAQPMGFYPPASLVRDAQRRGVEVRPPDVNRSEAKCSIEDERGADRARVRRVGRRGRGGGAADAREAGRSTSVVDLAQRAPLVGQDGLEALVASGACDSLGGRAARCSGSSASFRARRACPARAARSASSRCRSTRPPRRPSCASRPTGSGCSPTTARRASRSASTRWSCCARTCPPVSSRATTCAGHRTGLGSPWPGWPSRASGRRPRTGVVFMLLEDEHGQMNLIVPPPVYERHRAIVRGEPLHPRARASSSASSATRTSSSTSSRRSARSRASSPERRISFGAPGRPPFRPPLGRCRAVPRSCSPLCPARSRSGRLRRRRRQQLQLLGDGRRTWANDAAGARHLVERLPVREQDLGTRFGHRSRRRREGRGVPRGRPGQHRHDGR